MFITKLEKSIILERLRNLEEAVIRFTIFRQNLEKQPPTETRKVGRPAKPKTPLTAEEKAKRSAYMKSWNAKRKLKKEAP